MKYKVLALLALALTFPSPLSAQTPSPTKAPSSWKVIQDRSCGYNLRVPKSSKVSRPSPCVVEVRLPPVPGAPWIRECVWTLETSRVEKGEAVEKPFDTDLPPSGTLAVRGVRFDRYISAEGAAGKRFITVQYVGLSRTRQYVFLGLLTAVDPGILGTPLPHWDAKASARKIFDGLLRDFRPLE